MQIYIPVLCLSLAVRQVGQNFTFVLTDVESNQRFGFCQLSDGAQSVYCFLRWDLLWDVLWFHLFVQCYKCVDVFVCLYSYLPWFEVFYKLLNVLVSYINNGQVSIVPPLCSLFYCDYLCLGAWCKYVFSSNIRGITVCLFKFVSFSTGHSVLHML